MIFTPPRHKLVTFLNPLPGSMTYFMDGLHGRYSRQVLTGWRRESCRLHVGLNSADNTRAAWKQLVPALTKILRTLMGLRRDGYVGWTVEVSSTSTRSFVGSPYLIRKGSLPSTFISLHDSIHRKTCVCMTQCLFICFSTNIKYHRLMDGSKNDGWTNRWVEDVSMQPRVLLHVQLLPRMTTAARQRSRSINWCTKSYWIVITRVPI